MLKDISNPETISKYISTPISSLKLPSAQNSYSIHLMCPAAGILVQHDFLHIYEVVIRFFLLIGGHMYRMAVIPLLCCQPDSGLDVNRVIKLCLVHDLGRSFYLKKGLRLIGETMLLYFNSSGVYCWRYYPDGQCQ